MREDFFDHIFEYDQQFNEQERHDREGFMYHTNLDINLKKGEDRKKKASERGAAA